MEKSKKDNSRSCAIAYNEALQANELKVLDSNNMYPLYVNDKDVGMYIIKKTSTGKLQMVK